MDKRSFLKSMAMSILSCESVLSATAAENTVYKTPTILWVRRGNETQQFDYATQEGYRVAQYLLRDVQANQIGHPDWRLLQTLSWMQTWLALYGHHVCFDALSGLRTSATNRRTENAAQNSYHLPDNRGVFKAVDFRTKTIPSNYMGKLAANLQQGGVGFYQRDFTHIDTGSLTGSTGNQRIWHSN